MPLTAGTRLGPYVIEAPLGAGGMGEVYKARDTRLDRLVAIKILPSHLASADLRERFDREARVVSGLNHPNICVLHDVGHHDGIDFLVMEYLAGETLGTRLTRGALPPDDVVRYAIQIADALDCAHRQGIVHRDLKPGNIMIVKGAPVGTEIKLLDFGLAKLVTESPDPLGATIAPSIATGNQPLTAQGTILGTVQYMAPEQLEGSDAGARTDIFAFGVVLYEMATGRRAFQGKTTASLIGAILKDQPPPIAAVQPLTPPALEYLVAGCLAKDPDARWQSAHDLSKQLQWIQQARSHADVPSTSVTRRRRREYVAWGLAVLSGAALVALAIDSRPPQPVEEAMRFTIDEPSGAPFSKLAPVAPFPEVSPDGRRVAFVGGARETQSIFVRSLDSLDAQRVAGTETASFPFWSPDSRSLGFFVTGALKRIDLGTGGVQTICPLESFEGAAWNSDDVILFAKSGGGLFRVGARGGEPAAVTTLDGSRDEVSHRWPAFLPDGRHFVYLVQPGNHIYYGSLDGTPPRRLVDADAKAVYARGGPGSRDAGYLLYARGRGLVAHAFDVGRAELTGDPVPLVDEVRIGTVNARAAYSVSANGVLVYRGGATVPRTETAWVNRFGKPLDAVLPIADIRGLSLSPDGQRVAFHRHEEPEGGDIWVKDLLRGTVTRVTSNATHNQAPAWTPDGARVLFASARGASEDIYSKSANGTGDDVLVAKTGALSASHFSWAFQRPLLAFHTGGLPGTRANQNIWVLTRDGGQKPEAYLNSAFSEGQPAFAPGGDWIAYVANESGRSEVFVQPYPTNGQKYPISTEGGTQPRWRRDGRELYFLLLDGTLSAVPITISGGRFEAGEARPLFRTELTGAHLFAYQGYDVAADGQRFLVSRPPAGGQPAAAEPLTVVVNWPAALRRAR